MTDAELERINAERRRQGKARLSRQQIENLKSQSEFQRTERAARQDDGFDSSGFLFGYLTGMPISPSRGISAESIIGSALHESNDTRHDSAGSNDTSAADTSSSYSSDSSGSDSGSSSGGSDSSAP